jgi:predicted aminopeptidase
MASTPRVQSRSFARVLLASTLLCGCSLTRLGAGQLQLIEEQVPLSRAITREADPERKRLLQEVPSILAYAEDVVGLHAGASYRGYFATERRGLTYVLTACARSRFAAYRWWFPIVGNVEYRSYWDEAEAEASARELEARGYDTWLSPSRAYSSLGILRDPITTTMLRDGATGLTEVLIHELSHARLYVPGRTDWNEALASFVGEKGAERYFAAARFAGRGVVERMAARAQRRLLVDREVERAYTDLEGVYASGRSRESKLRAREVVFAALANELRALHPEDPPELWRVNNARLLHFHRYRANSAEFTRSWNRSGGDFRRFWAAVERSARLQL